MGINYSALAVKAKSLIGSNGAKCILVNPVEGVGTYNTKTKKYEKDEEKYEGFCIITEYKDHLIDGTVIRAGDRKAVVVISGEPIPGLSRLEIYNKKTNALVETYQVINGKKVNPDRTEVIVTHLHCRKL
jgi:hypothetical protein